MNNRCRIFAQSIDSTFLCNRGLRLNRGPYNKSLNRSACRAFFNLIVGFEVVAIAAPGQLNREASFSIETSPSKEPVLYWHLWNLSGMKKRQQPILRSTK